MASFLDKFKVQTAIDENTKLDLSCQHVTTQDFMALAPVYNKELVPGERISISQQSFTRMSAMPVPTFGRGNVHNRAFFVPYRTIFKGWTDFITDTKHVSAVQGGSQIPSSVPTFYIGELVGALMRVFDLDAPSADHPSCRFGHIKSVPYELDFQQNDIITVEGEVFDFSMFGYTTQFQQKLTPYYTNPGDNVAVIKWNRRGRTAIKILESLGYKISGSDKWKDVQVSALPLLAYLKVYLDWYYPSAYYDDSERVALEEILNYDTEDTPFILSADDLYRIMDMITFVNYDSDYFVSAFDEAVGPTNGAYSPNLMMEDITLEPNENVGGSSSTTLNYRSKLTLSRLSGTPAFTREKTTGSTVVTQYMIDSLKAVTDYMKRHQLVGARALDRYLARFGKSLSAEKLNRSVYIGHQYFGLQFGDIMSQADTTGAHLGDYAGKGLGFGDANFEFDTDEYGMLIICNSIVPTVGYPQGLDRTVLHKNRLDFWTPEFDQLGNQAIAGSELYVNTYNAAAGTNQFNETSNDVIFGFTPRYAEYKVAKDRLTGDFRIPTNSVSGDTSSAWHFMRLFNENSFDGDPNNIVHSKYFVLGNDASQYNRIFYNTNDTADHFYMIHNFNVVSYSPMCALYDTYEFDSEGKSVVADVNGVKVN